MKPDTHTRLAVMRQVAANKVALANGSPQFWAEVDARLDLIARAKLENCAPVNENLLGFALMLQAEVRRLRGIL